MKDSTRFAAAVGLAALLTQLPGVAGAQTNGQQNGIVVLKNGSSAVIVPDSTRMDSGAVNALVRMGNYLRTLDKFEVKGTFSREEVMTDGQKVQFTGTLNGLADRPTRLLAEINEERSHRIFLYDGEEFTLWAPRTKYYATVPFKGTIIQLADTLDDRFGIETPLVDLFRWGTESSAAKDLTGAKDLGGSVIDGTTTDHYAFRQDGLDWEVWIQAGDFPLPRKVVINTLTDEARPQYVAEYTWNLAPSYNETAFKFSAPKDAMRIKLAEIKDLKAKDKGGK